MTRLFAFLFAVLPVSATAHPHIFIDTGFDLIADDQGRLTHIRVIWQYDDYYSLLITEDLGIDKDYDGLLTPEEQTLLSGFDANWVDGYNGDLVVSLNGVPLVLSGPIEPAAVLDAGRIYSTHLRAVSKPLDLSGKILSIRPYDTTYYSAYDVTFPVTFEGLDTCPVEKIEPDLDGALSILRDQLASLGPEEDPNADQKSQIEDALATEVRVACPGS